MADYPLRRRDAIARYCSDSSVKSRIAAALIRPEAAYLYRCIPAGGAAVSCTSPSSAPENPPGQRTAAAPERVVSTWRMRCGRNTTIRPPKPAIYHFDALSHLVSTCACLWKSGYSGASRAYREPAVRRFYLVLDHETYFAGEHLGTLCPQSIADYIAEHCDPFAENAVGKARSACISFRAFPFTRTGKSCPFRHTLLCDRYAFSPASHIRRTSSYTESGIGSSLCEVRG